MPTYTIQVSNLPTGGDWFYILNDEELSTVSELETGEGQFSAAQMSEVIDYIVQHVDANSKFRVQGG